MKKLRDFGCGDCGKVDEHFVDDDAMYVRCSCGAEASRMVSCPRFMLDGSTDGFPGAHFKWIKEHEKAGRK